MNFLDEINDTLFNKILTYTTSQDLKIDNKTIYCYIKNDYLPHLINGYKELFTHQDWNNINFLEGNLNYLIDDTFYHHYEKFSDILYGDIKTHFDNASYVQFENTFRKQYENCLRVVLDRYH